MMLLGHIQKEDSTATILSIALGTAQQQVGISAPFLESNFSKYGYLLEDCWLKTVWSFLHEIGGSVTIQNIWTHNSPFENNLCLMDKVSDMDVPKGTIIQFNLCRLFKEVHFITDLYDSQFKELHPEIFRHTKRPFKDMKWPSIVVPQKFWKTWDSIIKTLHMSMSVSGFYPGKQIRKELFRFLQSTDRKHLLSKVGDKQYHVYRLDEFGRNKYIYSRTNIHYTVRFSLVGFRGVQVQIYDDVIVTDGFCDSNNYLSARHHSSKQRIITQIPNIIQQLVYERKRTYMAQPLSIKYTLPQHMEVPPTTDSSISELYTKLSKLDPMLQRNLGRIVEITNIHDLDRCIETGKVLAVGDASLGARDRASHAYILTTLSGKGVIQGEAPVDCDPDDLESTRAETYGMIAIQTIINVVCEQYEITCGEIEVYCDNKDALCKNKPEIKPISYPRYFRPNVDLKHLLWHLRDDKPPKLEMSFNHIKGHQDRNRDFNQDNVPKSVQLNIEMDSCAKKFLKQTQGKLEPRQKPLPTPTQKAYLQVSSTLIANNIQHHVSLHFFGPKMESRMSRVSDISTQYRSQIHWRAFEWAYKRLSIISRLPIFKLIHDKWYPAMAIAKFDPDKNLQYARYELHVETGMHVFQCPSQSAFKTHKAALTKLRSSLKKNDTAPIITEAMVQLLEHARRGYCDLNLRNVLASDEMRELTRNTMTHQIKIGIKYLLQGYISTHWVAIQNIYQKRDDFNDENICWARSLIAALWDYSVKNWNQRCEHINGQSETSMRRKKRQELVQMIQENLRRTKYNMDHDVQQLRRNISKSIGNANVTSLQTWLRMIRTVKEGKLQDKQQERIAALRAQPIIRFLVRR